ncbi:MAG: DUF4282 domain-containing protein [Mycobacterium sp.]|nr:DUF4282 domain-containing protein [Mycobacterium sp.]
MVDISLEDEIEPGFDAGGRSWPALTAFTDFGFRTATAQRLVPLLYGLVIAGALSSYVFVAVVVFGFSVLLGLFWLIVAGPIACVAVVLVARLVLEALLSVLAMSRQVDEANELVLEIAELVIGISDKIEVIPTLPFGRGGRSRRRAAIMDIRDRVVARRNAEAAD